jgi:hypothetical protein
MASAEEDPRPAAVPSDPWHDPTSGIIKNALNPVAFYKKPWFWIVFAVLIASFILSISSVDRYHEACKDYLVYSTETYMECRYNLGDPKLNN